MSKIWFISHPSGGLHHTPMFFETIKGFAKQNPDINLVWPHAGNDEVQATKNDLQSADLLLVEVSIPSTGSGIEMGWANDANKPIIAFHQAGTQPSPAVKFVTEQIHTYLSSEQIEAVLASLV